MIAHAQPRFAVLFRDSPTAPWRRVGFAGSRAAAQTWVRRLAPGGEFWIVVRDRDEGSAPDRRGV